MCTAITLKTGENHHLVGRNYDMDSSDDLSVVLAPRQFEYHNQVTNEELKTKYAILGMGILYQKHLILADGINEKGLSCMVLDLPHVTSWNQQVMNHKINLAPYDVVLWILSNFSSISEVIQGIKRLNIVALPNDEIAFATQVHWFVTDTNGQTIVIERTTAKFTIYNNKVGVLTNAPSFDWHLTNLDQYIKVQPNQVQDVKWGAQTLSPYSKGFGSIGLPGDFSSPSRFIKAAFLRNHVLVGESDESAIAQCFHILDNVSVIPGVVDNKKEDEYFTQYNCCICLEKQLYYYKTADNLQLQVVDLKKENLDAKGLKIFTYPLRLTVNYQN